jgi:hypothetical protein
LAFVFEQRMAQKKQGDLRLLKDGVAFGPTDRAGLERLLASGRVSLTDRVSVRDADWIPIAEYLAAPPIASDKPAPAPVPSKPANPGKKGELRVISGSRIIGSLRRDQVEQLRAATRIDDDDLICAANGPWMRVGDFFASHSAPVVTTVQAGPAPTAPADAVHTPTEVEWTEEVVEMEAVELEAVELETLKMQLEIIEPLPTTVSPAGPVRNPPPLPTPPRIAPQPPAFPQPPVLPQAAASPQATGGYRVAPRRPPAPPISDEWYVRVRGMYSASLRKHHVKALYEAQEVTRDSLARHGSWHDNDWRPIHTIAELADVMK